MPTRVPSGSRSLPNLVASWTSSRRSGDRLADELLVGERAVHVGGVEEGDAEVEGAVDGGDRLGLVGGCRRTPTCPCSRGRGRRRSSGEVGAESACRGSSCHPLNALECAPSQALGRACRRRRCRSCGRSRPGARCTSASWASTARRWARSRSSRSCSLPSPARTSSAYRRTSRIGMPVRAQAVDQVDPGQVALGVAPVPGAGAADRAQHQPVALVVAQRVGVRPVRSAASAIVSAHGASVTPGVHSRSRVDPRVATALAILASRVAAVRAVTTSRMTAYCSGLPQRGERGPRCGRGRQGGGEVGWDRRLLLRSTSAPRPSGRRPCAASTSARPGGRIRPAASSASTLATLTCDQRLRGRRGTYFWR